MSHEMNAAVEKTLCINALEVFARKKKEMK